MKKTKNIGFNYNNIIVTGNNNIAIGKNVGFNNEIGNASYNPFLSVDILNIDINTSEIKTL